MTVLDRLTLPIVGAPMAGGPSTPALAAAVSSAGGLGFVAAGYLSVDRLREDLAATRALTDAPIGVNVFAAGGAPADPAAVAAYVEALRPEAERAGVELGRPRFDDDAHDDKIALLCAEPVAVVSFTFGCPARAVVDRLHRAGSEVWVTVTHPDEAGEAAAAGADVLVAQGVEAGGHRAAFDDVRDPTTVAIDLGLLALLQLLRAHLDLPLVATGAIATGRAAGAALVAGAAAVQVGTAYLLTPEAGTPPAQRALLPTARPTAVTRAYSGRRARGLVNRLLSEHDAHAPAAYPEIHHVTAPLRAHGRRHGDADLFNLWAGQAHELARALPAAELTRRLAAEAREAVAEVHARLARDGA
jgi:nitronate monooxygenase